MSSCRAELLRRDAAIPDNYEFPSPRYCASLRFFVVSCREAGGECREGSNSPALQLMSRQNARMALVSSSGHSDGRKCPQPSPIAPPLTRSPSVATVARRRRRPLYDLLTSAVVKTVAKAQGGDDRSEKKRKNVMAIDSAA